jgi:hypothetical protein
LEVAKALRWEAGGSRDADPAGFCDGLEAGRDVDAVAIDASIVVDHVAESVWDAEFSDFYAK